MRYCFYLGAGLGLILLQSVVIPGFPLSEMCYDVLIPFVLYLSIFCPVIDSLVVIAVVGFLTDSMSVGAFGIYTISYVLIFILMKRLTAMVHISGLVLLSTLATLGVLIEDAIVFLMFVFSGNGGAFPDDVFLILPVRSALAMMTGGFVVKGLGYFHKSSDERSFRMGARMAK